MMDRITNINIVEDRLLHDMRHLIERVRDLAEHDVSGICDGIETLRKLRQGVYEDLNQIMHEALILSAARWLEENILGQTRVSWYWNPRQTGNSTEPDLRGMSKGKVILSAEATASEEPKGIIDRRMRDTLTKLSGMPGRRYYFVRTEKMARRANTKVSKHLYKIQVVIL